MPLPIKLTSLTLINWRGFFARTFELNETITALCGGNGAGKSTIMAALITALIPDLSLLQFRNTTEAGSTRASHQRGLRGKLGQGESYVLLTVNNPSLGTVLFGTHLLPLASNDEKVELKPFILSQLPETTNPVELFTQPHPEKEGMRQVVGLKVLTQTLKARGVACLTPQTLAQYHQCLFDLGVLMKPFRSQGERQRLYRLLEASLYGGLSSFVTRSLKDYLIQEQSGIKKAFTELEAVANENRKTLVAIQQTEASRDLFKHLLTQATHYLLAETKLQEHRTLLFRKESHLARKSVGAHEQTKLSLNEKQMALKTRLLTERDAVHRLKREYQTHQTIAQNLAAYHAKQQEIELLSGEIQLLATQEEAHERAEAQQTTRCDALNQEKRRLQRATETLYRQLADQKTLLNEQQIAKVKQEQAWERKQELLSLLGKTALSLEESQGTYQQTQRELQAHETNAILLTTKLSQNEKKKLLWQETIDKFSQFATLLSVSKTKLLADPLASRDLIQEAEQLMDKARHQAAYWKQQQQLEERALTLRKALSALWPDPILPSADELMRITTALNERVAQNQLKLDSLAQERDKMAEEVHQIARKEAEERRALDQFRTSEELFNRFYAQWKLSPFSDEESFLKAREALQKAQLIAELDLTKLREEKLFWEGERQRLQSEGNEAAPAPLTLLLETLNGKLLTHCGETFTWEEATTFSALFDPWKEAIVVANLDDAVETLRQNDLQPPHGTVLIAEKALQNDWHQRLSYQYDKEAQTIWVNDHAFVRRFASSSSQPWIGEEARRARRAEADERIGQITETLTNKERETVRFARQLEAYRTLASNSFHYFKPRHFEANSHQALVAIKLKQKSVETAYREAQRWQEADKAKLQQCERLQFQKEQLAAFYPEAETLSVEILQARANKAAFAHQKGEAANEQWQRWSPLFEWLNRLPGAYLTAWSTEEHEALKNSLAELNQKIQTQQALLFLLKDVIFRWDDLPDGSPLSSITQSLQLTQEEDRIKAMLEEHKRSLARIEDALHQEAIDATTLSRQKRELAKKRERGQGQLDLLTKQAKELHQPIEGIAPTEGLLETIEALKRSIEAKEQQIADWEEKRAQDYAAELIEAKRHEEAKERYYEKRGLFLKKASQLRRLKRCARTLEVESFLFSAHPECLSDENEWQKRGDISLGVLRTLVSDASPLSQSLKASENPKEPEKKIRFFSDTLQFLRSRIRKDLFQTDDPLQAIEEMEWELERLQTELQNRQAKLQLSSQALAKSIQKSIQRERARIFLLNEQLANLKFGQISAIRLSLSIFSAHKMLLNLLEDQQQLSLFSSGGPEQASSFTEDLGKLYAQLAPQTTAQPGDSYYQQLGETLLDHRNYFNLHIEVKKEGGDWQRADSGALSTGEAIGAGMGLLMMVMQSWEEESARIRPTPIRPARFLLLDEAARLDEASLNTLFDLAEKGNLQLILASPDNLTGGRGSFFYLRRTHVSGREHVHVIGVKSGVNETVSE